MESEKLHWLATEMNVRCAMSGLLPNAWNHRKNSQTDEESGGFDFAEKSFHVIMILCQVHFVLGEVFYLHIQMPVSLIFRGYLLYMLDLFRVFLSSHELIGNTPIHIQTMPVSHDHTQ